MPTASDFGVFQSPEPAGTALLSGKTTIWLRNASNFEMCTLDFVLLMFIYHRHKSTTAKHITIEKAHERKSGTRIIQSIIICDTVMCKNAYN
jgi:hypothetical protein